MSFVQATTAVNSGASAISHSFSANGLGSVTSVTNGIMFVLYDSAGLSTDPATVSFNGSLGAQSFTKLGTINQTTRGNTQSLWYLVGPGSGACTISDTYAIANAPNMVWALWDRAKQTAPEAFNTGSTTVANNLSVSVTTLSGNAWVLSFFTNNTGTGVAGANTTSRFAGVLSIGDTGGPIFTPSSQAQNWSLGGSTNWTGFSVSIAPDVAVATPGPALLMMTPA